MKKLLKIFMVAVFILSSSAVSAESIYPDTLQNGNLVCVDGGMGVGYYAVKNSVYVDKYAPPFYELSIEIIPVNFSDKYYRENETYIDSPYTFGEKFVLYFKYNWDTKTVFHKQGGIWKVWDINRDYSHAEGNPMIPNSAEVAFFSIYQMKFFGSKLNGSGYPVVSDGVHSALGI